MTSPRVLITGAASGLGRAMAIRFAQGGCRVCVADIHAERAQETLALIDKTPGEGFFERLDVTTPGAFDKARIACESVWGGTDILINNAGVASGGPFEWLSEEDWDYVMNINFKGVLRGCQAFVSAFRAQGHGHIVNIASMAGLLNPPGMSNYNVSKAAVMSLSESLAVELAPFNINVTCVCPSFFKTNLAESMRTPDKGTEQTIGRLLDSSPDITADTIADLIFNAVQQKRFLVLPHPRAEEAWAFKCKDLDAYQQSTLKMAHSVASRAEKNVRHPKT